MHGPAGPPAPEVCHRPCGTATGPDGAAGRRGCGRIPTRDDPQAHLHRRVRRRRPPRTPPWPPASPAWRRSSWSTAPRGSPAARPTSSPPSAGRPRAPRPASTPRPTPAAEALAAFVAELTPEVAAGTLLLEPGRGIGADDLADLRAADPRPAEWWEQRVALRAAGVAAAAAAACGGSLDGRTVAVEGYDDSASAVVDALTAAWRRHRRRRGRPRPPRCCTPRPTCWCVGSKAGVLDHDAVPGVQATVVVPSGPIPVTRQGPGRPRAGPASWCSPTSSPPPATWRPGPPTAPRSRPTSRRRPPSWSSAAVAGRLLDHPAGPGARRVRAGRGVPRHLGRRAPLRPPHRLTLRGSPRRLWRDDGHGAAVADRSAASRACSTRGGAPSVRRVSAMTDDLGIAWFRRDLRLDDNPAWAAATAEHGRVLALFVVDPALLDRAGPRRRRPPARRRRRPRPAPGRARRTAAASASATRRTVVAAEAAARGAAAVHANADVTPYAAAPRHGGRRRARRRRRGLAHLAGARSCTRPGRCSPRPAALSQVFTPFHRAWARTPWEPWPEPGDGRARSTTRVSRCPTGRGALPAARRAGRTRPPSRGRRGAVARLALAAERADRYDDERDRPDLVGTSELSADLRFGTLSPRTVADVVGEASAGRAALVRQLAWRDWYAHLLLATPDARRPADEGHLRRAAVARRPRGVRRPGRTGAPATRWSTPACASCAATGWMHNRVRMITASFLVKNLLVDWRVGERWFRHLLIDGDVPQNVGQLAVGGRHRARRLALQPGVQPGRSRATSSTPTATTCAGGCPSWPGSPAAPSTSRGRSGRSSWPPRVSCSATTTRPRSSTWRETRARALAAYAGGEGLTVRVSAMMAAWPPDDPDPRPGAPEAPRLPERPRPGRPRSTPTRSAS